MASNIVVPFRECAPAKGCDNKGTAAAKRDKREREKKGRKIIGRKIKPGKKGI